MENEDFQNSREDYPQLRGSEGRLVKKHGGTGVGGAIGSFFLEIVKIVVISLAVIIPVRYFIVQPFIVSGASMLPNFSDGEYLIINEIVYDVREPERGEVVVFRFPRDPSQFFIKRIIGLPGETVEISGGEVVIFNDENPGGYILEEAYLPSALKTPGTDVKMELGDNEYFVLGDNRSASSDSRTWGSVTKDAIIGKAWLRFFPVDDIASFETPTYPGIDK